MLSFRWLNPRGTELWNSTGELQLEGKQDPVIEVDLPVIAVVDLPLDIAGRYTMQVDLDGQSITHTQLFVTGPAPALPFTGPQKTLVS
jgi:hypothetical protein